MRRDDGTHGVGSPLMLHAGTLSGPRPRNQNTKWQAVVGSLGSSYQRQGAWEPRSLGACQAQEREQSPGYGPLRQGWLGSWGALEAPGGPARAHCSILPQLWLQHTSMVYRTMWDAMSLPYRVPPRSVRVCIVLRMVHTMCTCGALCWTPLVDSSPELTCASAASEVIHVKLIQHIRTPNSNAQHLIPARLPWSSRSDSGRPFIISC